MFIYEFSVLRLVFFSTFLGLVYFTLSFFGFFFEFLEINDFFELGLLTIGVFGLSLEINVHLRISCLEVIVVFDFLVFSIFLLSLLMFFFEFLEISDYLDLVLLRLVVFGRSLEISVHLRISCLEVSIFFNFLVFGIFLLSLTVFFLRIS